MNYKNYKYILPLIVITLVIATILSSCQNSLRQYDEVVDYFNENKELFVGFPFEDAPPALTNENKKYVKDYFGQDTIIIEYSLYDQKYGNFGIFTCGVKGWGGNFEYNGLYFSETDKPYGLEFNGCPVEEREPGVYVFNYSDPSGYVWTKKLCDNWYYFYKKDY